MFWSEELYKYTLIYNSMTPLMRFCVDMKILGRTPEYIAKTTKKEIQTIYKTIRRAKKRYENAEIRQIRTQGIMNPLEKVEDHEQGIWYQV
jgi:hypothetical protein